VLLCKYLAMHRLSKTVGHLNQIPTPSTNTSSTATIARADSDRLVLRRLELGDYQKGFLQLLAQLSDVGEVDQQAFTDRFRLLSSFNECYHILVIEDISKQILVATATLFIELKFLHNCGKVGHVEDVVVDSRYRGLNLGFRIVEAVTKLADSLGCYKIILDCSVANVPFYQKLSYVEKERQMAKYFKH